MLKSVINLPKCGIKKVEALKGVKMEILNLVMFGCIFYMAIIGIPTFCENLKK